MLGLLGLMGAVMAGLMVDALMVRDPDEAGEGGEDASPDGPGDESDPAAGDLLADEHAEGSAEGGDAPHGLIAADRSNDGHPQSDDQDDPDPQDQALHGGAGNDILTGQGGNDQIHGDAGNDLLGGRAGNDLLSGDSGHDWLRGGSGLDTLSGGTGDDDLAGENGRDLLAGGSGDDSQSGGAGADRLFGGRGDDDLNGGMGADRLWGEDGRDALQGGQGNDQALGGEGEDTVEGGDGNDRLWGGNLNADDREMDFLNGGTGDDVLHLGAADYGNGGEGADRFELSDIAIGDPVAQITDFDPDEDKLVLLYDAETHADPEVSVVTEEGSADATVVLDGVPVARVMGGAGLSAADVMLRAA